MGKHTNGQEISPKRLNKSNSLLSGPVSKIFIVAMLALPVINWLVFWLGVNMTSILMAFQDYNGGFTFGNFESFWVSMTTAGGTILIALKNTLLYFSTSEFILFPLSIVVGYFLYKKILGYKFFRVVFYLPAIISPIAMTQVFRYMIMSTGPVGSLLISLGMDIPPQGLLGTAETATNTILVYTLWTGICTNMLIISGGMARVPIEVLESAKLDGVGAFKELIYMIVPLMWPTISTLLILSLTGLINASGPILLLTDSSSYALETQTMSYWIFEKVWKAEAQTNVHPAAVYGQVAAAGLFFSVILIPLVYGARWLAGKIPTVEY